MAVKDGVVDDFAVPMEFYGAENRCICISPRVKHLWAVLIDMIVVLDRLCRKYDISYVVDGGTMLGAMRHGGFVPWDDDIDVIMKRPEYERLRAVAHELPDPYFFQDYHTDTMACRGHAQLRNNLTTGILKGEMRNGVPLYRFNQGVFLDIFVMDNVPDDEALADAFMRRLAHKKKEMLNVRDAYAASVKSCLKPSPTRLMTLVRIVKAWIYNAFHKEDYLFKVSREFDELAQSYNGMKTKRFSHLTFMPNPSRRLIFDATILDARKRCKFEMIELPVPNRADEYLRQVYGNWHEHVVGTACHGGVFFDTEKPYTEYLKK